MDMQASDMGASPMDQAPTADEQPTPGMPEQEGNGIVHIPGDMLPESIRGKCKPGDKLTFEVVGAPDAEGDVPVEFESGAGYTSQSKPEEEGGEPWEDDFRKAMSPRNSEEGSPMPKSLETEGY